MKASKRIRAAGITRRDLLKASGSAFAGLALAGTAGKAIAAAPQIPRQAIPVAIETPPAPGTMRITFCGTWYTPRPNQSCNSIFVEVGNGTNNGWGDSFVFDCGSGVCGRYTALGVPFSRMAKIFITHLHGDHTSDLFNIYCFGPSSDRKFPLEVWGPSGDNKNEGTWFFCQNLLQLGKWHRNSFSFLPTGYLGDGDGFDLIAHELRYMENPGVAYNSNGVKISHFPAIHARDGSISYKLEWNGFSMVFSGDTKPNTYMLENAKGVDVLIHEMTAPPGVWTTRQTGYQPQDEPNYSTVTRLNTEVIENSHTVQTAFGYIMSQTKPRLAVATHFPGDPDLIDPAMCDIRHFYPQGDVMIAADLDVITIDAQGHISASTAKVPAYNWWHAAPITQKLAPARYDSPLAQFNNELLKHIIPVETYTSPLVCNEPTD